MNCHKRHLKEIECESVDWTELAQEKIHH